MSVLYFKPLDYELPSQVVRGFKSAETPNYGNAKIANQYLLIMKKTNKKSMFKRMAVVLCTVLIGALSSCSSDDNGGTTTNPGGEGKQIKLTITANGVLTDDYLSFVAVGGALSGANESTVWKVNGVTQTNEESVSLDKNDFAGTTKTYDIESVVPLRLAVVGMQFLANGTRLSLIHI